MRNETESSKASSKPGVGPVNGRRPAPASAFSQAFLQSFLRRASRLEELPSSAPPALAAGKGALWAGPWEVERVELPHGLLWAVVRRGERVAEGGGAVAVARHRSDAVLLAAALPVLAVPNRLRPAGKGRRLGFPLHDGAACVGHLARSEPRIVEHLHAIRTLLNHPECLALAVEALGGEEIPILCRALMRWVEVVEAL